MKGWLPAEGALVESGGCVENKANMWQSVFDSHSSWQQFHAYRVSENFALQCAGGS